MQITGIEWIEDRGEYDEAHPAPSHEHDGYSSGF